MLQVLVMGLKTLLYSMANYGNTNPLRVNMQHIPSLGLREEEVCTPAPCRQWLGDLLCSFPLCWHCKCSSWPLPVSYSLCGMLLRCGWRHGQSPAASPASSCLAYRLCAPPTVRSISMTALQTSSPSFRYCLCLTRYTSGIYVSCNLQLSLLSSELIM